LINFGGQYPDKTEQQKVEFAHITCKMLPLYLFECPNRDFSSAFETAISIKQLRVIFQH